MRGFKSKLFKCSRSTVEISEVLLKEISPINTFILIHELEDNKGYSIISICSCGIPYIGKYLFGDSRKYLYVNINKPIFFTGTINHTRSFSTSYVDTGFLGWAIIHTEINTIDIINNNAIPSSYELIKSALTK